MKTLLGVAGALTLAFALTGCGSTSPSEPVAVTSTPSPKPTTYFGETASAIAALVPACSSIQPGDIGKGGPGMASTASCVIGGRTVDFYSWHDAAAQDGVANLIQADKDEAYYAAGTGWTAHVRRDMTLQWQLTDDAEALMRSANENHTSPAADLPGEKSTAEQIVAALGGSVKHIS